MRIVLLPLLASMALSSAAAAQEVVYVIRHAEKELTGADLSLPN